MGTIGTLPRDISDVALREKLAAADVPALLMYVAAITGDTSVLRPEWCPDPAADIAPSSGLPDDLALAARETCFAHLVRARDAQKPLNARPSSDVLEAIIAWAVGPDALEYAPLAAEFLMSPGEDNRRPQWRKSQVAALRDVEVAIVGAGMVGLLAGYRLKQAEVPFTIYDKNPDVGGTWYENTYPGCRVDVPSYLYSFSFVDYDWPEHFTRQELMLQYLREFANSNGLYEHIQFNTEVCSAAWQEDDGVWELCIRDSEQRYYDSRPNVFISAVGQLNRPSIPDIAGRDSFSGPTWHSAQWDHSVDLKGKRVGVIGTGASALQFIPEVAKVASEVVVFQRTPPWLLATPNQRAAIDDATRWLYRNLPGYKAWYRLRLLLPKLKGQLDAATVDMEYGPSERAISAASEAARQAFTAVLTDQLQDAPWLAPHVIPQYPVGAKRPIRDDGTWIRSLKRDNVRLDCSKILEITPSGVRTSDGEHDVDVLIYGTGFKATDFLVPMEVVGRSGVNLHQQWKGDPRAYFGLTVPDFPNMFILYGPNTNLVVHANLVFFFECQVTYLMSAIGVLLRENHSALSVRRDVFERHRQQVDDANAARAWAWSSVSSWYKSGQGRSANMWPLSTIEYWAATRCIDPADYETH